MNIFDIFRSDGARNSGRTLGAGEAVVTEERPDVDVAAPTPPGVDVNSAGRRPREGAPGAPPAPEAPRGNTATAPTSGDPRAAGDGNRGRPWSPGGGYAPGQERLATSRVPPPASDGPASRVDASGRHDATAR